MKHHHQEEKLIALNSTIKKAKCSLFYSNKLKDIKELKSLVQLSTLPFTTKNELRESYPFNSLCVDIKDVIEMHTTSGTTGKPTLSFYNKKDLEIGSEAISRAWKNFGINNENRVQFIMGYGLFSGAMLNTYALQRLGAFVLPSGIQPTAKQVELMIDFEIDTIVATPGFLLYLYEFLKNNKISRSKLKLVRAIAAGEVYSNITREQIEKKLKIKVYDHYGLCEVNTGIAYECDQRKGLHLLDDYIIAEIIDPQTGELLPDGQYGELVLTSLKKEASPIIRYRTGDVSCIFSEPCACGNKSIRLGRITTRVDDLLFIKGLKINPHELKEFILSLAENQIFGGDMKIKVKKNSIKYTPQIFLTFVKNNPILISNLKDRIREKTGITFDIKHVEASYFNREANNKVKFIEYV
jgi:phenylacetate-CoA ligase